MRLLSVKKQLIANPKENLMFNKLIYLALALMAYTVFKEATMEQLDELSRQLTRGLLP